jgi:type I restriction enzyme S subunit
MIADRSQCDYRFLFYKLKEIRSGLLKLVVAGAQRNLSSGIIKSYQVSVPALSTQRAIADILSGYDDLIENNRRRIALLEQAARMLYREWFVRFNFPGHEHVKIVDGVPEGWSARRLNECVSFQSGGTPSKAKSEYWLGDVPWISSGELTTMRVSTSQNSVTDDAVAEGSRYAERDTILAVVRGMSLAKEFRVGIVSRRVCFNQDIKALVPDKDVEGLFLFHTLFDQKENIRQRAGEASHGTKKLERAVLETLRVIVPSPAVRRRFIDHVEPMHAQWDVLHQQCQQLAQAREPARRLLAYARERQVLFHGVLRREGAAQGAGQF